MNRINLLNNYYNNIENEIEVEHYPSNLKLNNFFKEIKEQLPQVDNKELQAAFLFFKTNLEPHFIHFLKSSNIINEINALIDEEVKSEDFTSTEEIEDFINDPLSFLDLYFMNNQFTMGLFDLQSFVSYFIQYCLEKHLTINCNKIEYTDHLLFDYVFDIYSSLRTEYFQNYAFFEKEVVYNIKCPYCLNNIVFSNNCSCGAKIINTNFVHKLSEEHFVSQQILEIIKSYNYDVSDLFTYLQESTDTRENKEKQVYLSKNKELIEPLELDQDVRLIFDLMRLKKSSFKFENKRFGFEKLNLLKSKRKVECFVFPDFERCSLMLGFPLRNFNIHILTLINKVFDLEHINNSKSIINHLKSSKFFELYNESSNEVTIAINLPKELFKYENEELVKRIKDLRKQLFLNFEKKLFDFVKNNKNLF